MLCLVVVRYVTEGLRSPRVSWLEVVQLRVRRKDRRNFVERALYNIGLIALGEEKVFKLWTIHSLLPVDVDAGLGEHEEPEVHVPGPVVDGGHGVVDQHPTVGQPQDSKYGHNYDQHFHNLNIR